jgi:uncharacterized RDD family membrane protein YckC
MIENHSDNVEYAGFWIRVLASFIDFIIIGLFVFLLHKSMLSEEVMTMIFMDMSVKYAGSAFGNLLLVLFVLLPLLIYVAGILLYFFYEIIFTSSSLQATLGKRICGLKVVTLDLKRVSIARSFCRYFLKSLSTIFAPIFLVVAFSDRKQGLHDKFAKTLIIKRSSLIADSPDSYSHKIINKTNPNDSKLSVCKDGFESF